MEDQVERMLILLGGGDIYIKSSCMDRNHLAEELERRDSRDMRKVTECKKPCGVLSN